MATKIDFWYLIREIDGEMSRLSWTEEQGREYLKRKYGTHTRFRLNDQQLLEFRDYLKALPNKRLKLKKINLRANFPMNRKRSQSV